MDFFLFSWPEVSPIAALSFGGYSLMLGGAALIFAGIRARRDLVGKRVDLVVRTSDFGWKAGKAAGAKIPGPLLYAGDASSVEREVVRRFSKFGVSAKRAPAIFLGMRIVTLLALSLLAALAAPQLQLTGSRFEVGIIILLAAGAGWSLPAIIIGNLAKARAVEILDGLPDALDLLVICAEAGLALEDGIERVAAELKLSQPVLSGELQQVAADLKILPNSEQALGRLAKRVDAPAVRSLVGTLSQTMRYGTPLAQAMRVVAAQIRNDSLLQLEERANKLPALMTVPMILLIMPTIYLILAGPAALSVLDALGR